MDTTLLCNLTELVLNNEVSHLMKMIAENELEIKILLSKNIDYLIKITKSAEIMKILSEYCSLDGFSLLTYCINKQFDIEILKKLVLWGEEINEIDENFITPLCLAVSQINDLVYIEDLIKLGADVNLTAYRGECGPLHLANSTEIIRLLLKYGADINLYSALGCTPLHTAIKSKKSKEIIFELIRNGADIHKIHQEVESPLMLALIYNYDIDLITEFVNNGASVKFVAQKNTLGFHKILNTLLHCTNNRDIITYLVKNGAPINIRIYGGTTPLGKALVKGNYNLSMCLLENGADPNCLRELHGFLFIQKCNSDKLLNLLSWYGADFNVDENEDFYSDGFFLKCGLLYKIGTLSRIHLNSLKYFLLSSDFNTDYVCSRFDDFYKILGNFLNHSKTEFEKMKTTYVSKDVTFYDVCKKNYTKFVHVSDFEGISILESSGYLYNIDEICEMFPIFKNIIIFRLKRHYYDNYRKELSIKLNNLILAAFATASENKPTTSNEDIKLKILRQLSNSPENIVVLNYDCLLLIAKLLTVKEIFKLLLASV